MITQVLEPVLLSHLYHSCALKSVRKAFFDCLSVWITKHRQRFCNEVLQSMEDLILPPPKATALSPTSVEVELLLKSLGKERSSQGGTASLHHSGAARGGKKHNQTHFPTENCSFFVHAVILQMGKIIERPLALCSLNFFPVACKLNFHSYHGSFRNIITINAILWECDVWCT